MAEKQCDKNGGLVDRLTVFADRLKREGFSPGLPGDEPLLREAIEELERLLSAPYSWARRDGSAVSHARQSDTAQAELACKYSRCVNHDLRKSKCDHCPIDALPSTTPCSGETPRMDATLGKGADWVFAEGCKLERELAAVNELLAYANGQAMQMGDELERLQTTASATPRITTMPLIKRLKGQRDELADAVRPLVALVKEEQWNLRARRYAHAYALAAAALDKCQTYEQQVRNIAEGIGMTYDELMAAMNNRADGGKQTNG
jgi:hypothetical protein